MDQSSNNIPCSSAPSSSQLTSASDNNLVNMGSNNMADMNVAAQDAPMDGLFLNDDSFSFIWGQTDHGFESMVELFPDSWPL